MAGNLRHRAGPRRRVFAYAVTATFALALAVPSLARATVSCSYDSGLDLLQVDIDAPNDSALLAVSSVGVIQVRGGGPVLSCAGAGGPATVTNTNTVFVFDNSDDPITPAPADGSTRVSILQGPSFAPGATLEPDGASGSEIEFFVDLKGGTSDRLQLSGTPVADHIVLGKSGIDWNAAAAPDVELVSSVLDEILIGASAGDDVVSAQGGPTPGAGAPYDRDTELELTGDDGDDTVAGGDGAAGDLLEGGPGNDVMRGFDGSDVLIPDALGSGDDTVVGGAGSDWIRHPLAIAPLAVDLAETTAQDTGQGTDVIEQIENVDGSPEADMLLGNEAANTLRSLGGDDVLDGRAGGDDLQGGSGVDSVTYVGAPAGVTVDLTAGTVAGGDTDTLLEIDDLIGSPFPDSLSGSAEANAITGLGGVDVVDALGGADAVDVRDGGRDTVSCGTEIDTASADVRGIDVVDADCERIDYLPEAPVVGGPGSPLTLPQPDGPGELEFRLTGAKRQRLLRQKAVVVRVHCPDEACTAVARASGTLPKLRRERATAAAPLKRLDLKAVTRRLDSRTATTLRLPLSKRQRRAVRLRLAAGKRPKLVIRVRATGAGDRSVTRRLRVTARR